MIVYSLPPELIEPYDRMMTDVVLRKCDGIGRPVDTGIASTVALFRLAGFLTTASCEGHINRGVPYPWIVITPARADLDEKVLNICLTNYYKHHPGKEHLLNMDVLGGNRICGKLRLASNIRHKITDPVERQQHLDSTSLCMQHFVQWCIIPTALDLQLRPKPRKTVNQLIAV